jgi:hypothetical protein
MRTIVLALFCFAFAGCSVEPRTETSPKNYPSLLADWTSSGLVSHFPNPLPSTATNVTLSAYPGFLQGGAWFQVRLTLPPADVAKAFDTASNTAKDFYDGGGVFESTNAKHGGLPGTSFHTSGAQETDFPADYRVFVYGAQDHGGHWNHGNSYGIVVSKQRNEVIYFAENW